MNKHYTKNCVTIYNAKLATKQSKWQVTQSSITHSKYIEILRNYFCLLYPGMFTQKELMKCDKKWIYAKAPYFQNMKFTQVMIILHQHFFVMLVTFRRSAHLVTDLLPPKYSKCSYATQTRGEPQKKTLYMVSSLATLSVPSKVIWLQKILVRSPDAFLKHNSNKNKGTEDFLTDPV